MRQVTLFVEFDNSGFGVRPQLSSGGTEGVGSLQGMASLHAALALTALTNVDVELAVNRLARNLHLELLGDVRFVEGSAAVLSRMDILWGLGLDSTDSMSCSM
jgi:hypothetical protein